MRNRVSGASRARLDLLDWVFSELLAPTERRVRLERRAPQALTVPAASPASLAHLRPKDPLGITATEKCLWPETLSTSKHRTAQTVRHISFVAAWWPSKPLYWWSSTCAASMDALWSAVAVLPLVLGDARLLGLPLGRDLGPTSSRRGSLPRRSASGHDTRRCPPH